WSQRMFDQELESSFSLQAVAVLDEKPVAFGIGWKVRDVAQILEFAVTPQERRKGIGSKILKHLMQIARENGCAKMELELRSQNLAALEFYRKFGFRQVGKRKNFYPSSLPLSAGEDALLMECVLF
ncbi:MAG: ribosomal protein S18-alanine N-acetyltransferase, partial [Elusimicrobia bacterium]|nr:ribosomal protein S18-alanine N-acetyltransferase [Elusimicrobiota bacterium]